jgi:hypothetical protein
MHAGPRPVAQGQLTGTADDNTGVISRTYTGTAHFD